MSQPSPDTSAAVFERMDAKARQVIEHRFRVRLNSSRSSQQDQAAWDVYHNATVKLLEALQSGTPINDPEGYAATIARNRCYDYWRAHSPDWYDLKGRLYRFLGKQDAWTRWKVDELRGWICAPAAIRSKALAEGSRIAELLDQPRRINARALPKFEVFQKLEAYDWDRLLTGIFDYLGGPIRLDELVSIAGVLFGVKGSRELAFPEPDPENGRAWEPAAVEQSALDKVMLREQLARVWAELIQMPKRWFIPFLLNPPTLRGAQAKTPRNRGGPDGPARAERGEVEVFTANGLTTVKEIARLMDFGDDHYRVLWQELQIEARGGPALEILPDPALRFGEVWKFLPLEDDLIARLLGLESGQKVINLRLVAKNHLAKTLTLKKSESVG